MYLWKILHVDKSELIFRVYQSQLNSSNPGDWVRLVTKDKQTIGLDLNDEEITSMSKGRFKNQVKSKVTNYALSELNAAKEKHSKSAFLHSSSFKTAEYLEDHRFSKLESQILFRLRTQTLNVKMNFGNPEDKLCQVCKLFPETQSHLLQCSEQLQIAKLYSKVLEIRRKNLEERKSAI
jgi:hypothetical protein